MDDFDDSRGGDATFALWLVGSGAFMLGLFKLFLTVKWHSPLFYLRSPWTFLDNLMATLSFAVGPTLLVVGLLLWVGAVFGEGNR